jgi:hypothetical protein
MHMHSETERMMPVAPFGAAPTSEDSRRPENGEEYPAAGEVLGEMATTAGCLLAFALAVELLLRVFGR